MAKYHLDSGAKDLLDLVLADAIATYDDTSRQGDVAAAMVIEAAENGDTHADTIISWTLRTHLAREASAHMKASLGKLRVMDGRRITRGGAVPVINTSSGNTRSWRQTSFEAMTRTEFESWGDGWAHRADSAESALVAFRLGLALYAAFPSAQTLGEALRMKGVTAEEYFGDMEGILA